MHANSGHSSDTFNSALESGSSNIPHGLDNSVNSPNIYGNVPLHVAIMQDDINMLEHLLDQPNIDVNYKSYKGETPLLMSLWRFRNDDFIMRLLEAGCDPNNSKKCSQTPLHIAMLRPSLTIAYELIKRGADVNAQDENNRTALHLAVNNNNFEGVCMLLYYAADVSIVCKDNMTAFMFALYLNRERIAQTLFHFCDDFTCMDVDGYTALHFAAKAQNPIAFDLVRAGADVNCVTIYKESPLFFSLDYKSMELFKLMWSKVDHKLLAEIEPPFLSYYVSAEGFSTADDFMECLYLIFRSPKIYDLLNSFMFYGSFKELLSNCYRLRVEPADRLAIIYFCLSLGFQPNVDDINRTYAMYGFNDELEALIYSFDCTHELSCLDSPLLHFILGQGNYSFTEIRKHLAKYTDVNVRNYFSAAFYHIANWEDMLRSNNEDVMKVAQIIGFPSLRELSRNEANRFILQNYKIEKPHQFHGVVKSLRLPPAVQDIVRFKTPLMNALYKSTFGCSSSMLEHSYVNITDFYGD